MSILTAVEFVQSLIPRMGKEDVVSDIATTVQEFETLVLPVVTALNKEKKSLTFSESISKEISVGFFRHYKGKGKNNLVEALANALPNIITNMKIVRDQLDSKLEADVISAGLTAEKATLLRIAEHGAFITDYALDVLSVAISEDIKQKNNVETTDSIPPIKIKRLTDNAANFGVLVNAYSIDENKFKEKIDSIPPVTFNAETATLLKGTYGDSGIDPFNAILASGFTGNPIYHMRMVWEEYQNKRYRAKAEKKRMLELKILQLKHLNEGRNDPKVESQIEYIQNRVNELEYDMERMKE